MVWAAWVVVVSSKNYNVKVFAYVLKHPDKKVDNHKMINFVFKIYSFSSRINIYGR